MANYLITGGAGFIGSHLADLLTAAGGRVTVFDNLSSGHRANLRSLTDVQFIEGDILDQIALESAVRGIDAVFHLAAAISVAESIDDPRACLRTNVDGTFHVLEAARKAGIRRVVLASSCAVYGDVTPPPVGESSALSPQSPYAASKAMNEALAEAYFHSYGLEAVCLRFFNVYGPRQRADSGYAAAIPKFIDRISRRLVPTIFGDGLQTRDFVHVRDVARALKLAGEGSSEALKGNRVFNVGSGKPTAILDLLDIIREKGTSRSDYEILPPRPGEVRHSYSSVELAKRVLGFSAEIGISEGIQELIAL
jgi:UDP-glucose 4-epimerase